MEWPWISRKKHEQQVAELESERKERISMLTEEMLGFKIINKGLHRELRELKEVGFNMAIDQDLSQVITVGVTQGFAPDVILKLMEDPDWLKERTEEITMRLIRGIAHYARGG